MEFFAILPLVFLLLNSVNSQGVNCNGKNFICLNTTSFLDCVEVGTGNFVTLTSDSSPCAAGTVCNVNNNLSCQIPPVTTTPSGFVNCNGKGFICTDTTHFIECVDLGGGVSITLDNKIQTCVPGTFCRVNNTFECEAPGVSTVKTTRRANVTTTRKANVTTRRTVNATTVRKPITTRKANFTTKIANVTKAANVTTKKPTTPSTNCPRSGNFADPADCHIFYSCVGSLKVKFFCPFNQVFDSAIGSCNTNKDSCASTTFRCAINGHFQDPKNCYSFFSCQRSGNKFIAVRQTCGDSQTFYSYAGKCMNGKMGCVGKIPIVISHKQ